MFSARVLTNSALRASTRPLLHSRLPIQITPAFRISVAAMSSISEAITSDHREIEKYYNEVVNSNDPDYQQRYGNQFTWELARHSVGEELIVYPAFEKYVADGKSMADKDRSEHHEVKLLLKEFQNMSSKDSEYVPKIKQIMGILAEHIKDEEEKDLPALEQGLAKTDKEESAALAKKFGLTKAFVPSRSHPSAGENPPFETVMGLLTAPIDHIADIFRKFPDKTISPNPSTK